MSILPCMLLAAVTAAPQVDVATLKGEQHAGALQQLTAAELTLRKDGAETKVPLSEVLEVRFAREDRSAPNPAAGGQTQAILVDGSRLGCTGVAAGVRDATLTTAAAGAVKVPVTALASLRFAPPSDSRKIEDDWSALRQRELKRDLLVVRKGDVLDHLDGTIGEIDDKLVKFVLDGDEIPVKREKVFGIVYARNQPANQKAVCEAMLGGSDVLRLKSIAWDGQQWQAALVAGGEVTLAPEALAALDFSLGKVRYLSQMEPRQVDYTPFFDIVWRYWRDRNQDNGPLQLGGTVYPRGLSIHSRTVLQYRIDGDYRRFQAVMGIDDSVGRYGRGDVHVVISGDGKPLLEADVRGTDAPRPLDLDVTGVRDLEILVDFGGDLDIADHLDLADAKVIK